MFMQVIYFHFLLSNLRLKLSFFTFPAIPVTAERKISKAIAVSAWPLKK
jgi:hypothetical protein